MKAKNTIILGVPRSVIIATEFPFFNFSIINGARFKIHYMIQSLVHF